MLVGGDPFENLLRAPKMLELALNVSHPWVRGEKMAFVCETERLSRLKDTPVLHTSIKHRTRRLFKRISSGKEKLKCS